MRVLTITTDAFPGHEGRNLKLCSELIRRGHEVVHTGPAESIQNDKLGITVFRNSFTDSTEARQANTQLFASWRELTEMINRADVMVLGMDRNYQSMADHAAAQDKIIVWMYDNATMHVYAKHADIIAVRGEFDRRRIISRDVAGPEDVHITGCTMFDDELMRFQRLDRAGFCRKYGLDENKKLAVFLSTAPAAHGDIIKNQYRRICGTIKELPDFDLIIKPHPRDYAGAKQSFHYDDTAIPTWEQLAPGIPACAAEDKYDCFRHSEVLIAQNSSVFMEAAFFHKPILEVATSESRFRDSGMDLEMLRPFLPNKRHSPPCRGPWYHFGCLQPIYKNLPDGPVREWAEKQIAWVTKSYPAEIPDYIGSECSLDELKEILSSGAYRVDDDGIYDDYLLDYSLPFDGKAYLRLADLVERIETDPALAAKLSKARRSRRLLPLRRGLRFVRSLLRTG